ncbi:unnamed protein product [Ilex paraguariensis]|uniref:Potassium transporter n=1 Tax=Ilex paraguariensis TaxID=185542 RepID=A0ABC8QL01_9AQUA
MGDEGVNNDSTAQVEKKHNQDHTTTTTTTNLKERKVSWAKLRRVDSLNLEAGRVSSTPNHSSKADWKRTLSLAFQSIGVIYGDIGTSPLYVFSSTFPDGIHNTDDIYGVLSFIIYTIALIPLLKYVFIVLWANDNGDGGTFALYSLICRYAKVSLIPNQQPEDRELSNYRLDTPSNQLKRAQKIKQKLESSKIAKIVLFLVTILGTSMVIGDGVLTPCISDPIYWPTFVVAVAAAIIASQAMISGAFAIISQSLRLGCFPRVKVVHTSAKYEGQVYIPEINYLLMVACVIVTFAFKTTEKIGNAYGIAVVAVMVITTCMITLIMLVVWKTSIWWISLFFVVFGSIEFIYLSSVLYKFKQGGFLPLAFSLVLVIVMGIWHYVHKQRYMFELNNKVSSDYIRDLAKNQDLIRVPGIGLLYSELVQGIPPIFPHFISNIPSIHSVLVLVSIKSIPISKVALEERFLFRQVEPRDYRMFRCVVRYGYKDKILEPKEFEQQLVEHLKEFIRHEHFILEGGLNEQMAEPINNEHSSPLVKDAKVRGSSPSTVHIEESLQQQDMSRFSSSSIQSFNAAKSTHSSSRTITGRIQEAEEEIQFVQKAMDIGVVYLIGEAEVIAKQNSSVLKKIVVNYAYNFLRKNFRQGEKVIAIPRTRLLRVGMTYEI